MRERGQLPFAADAGTAGSHQYFDLSDALKLRLMLDLMDEGGVSADLASFIVRGARPQLHEYGHPLSRPSDDSPELFLGAALVRPKTRTSLFEEPGVGFAVEDDEEPLTSQVSVAGDLRTVADVLSDSISDDEEILRLVLANVTRAARYVRDRARGLGLPEADQLVDPWAET
ncbi:MAG: hypothetical protein AAF192_11910 [Pseudomonadota bacterium]